MNKSTETAPVCTQNGRKGITYDWQSLYAAAGVDTIGRQLATLAPATR